MAPTIEEFVTARGAALLRFALMISGQPHLAEDLVQSVLGLAYPRWHRIAAMELPEAYLKQMLVHEHLRWRRRRSSGEVPVAATGFVALEADAVMPHRDETADRQASRDAAWALLARLPRRQRAVLVLRYYEDLTDAQIATILGCREATVRSQASRGIAALRAAVPELAKELLP